MSLSITILISLLNVKEPIKAKENATKVIEKKNKEKH